MATATFVFFRHRNGEAVSMVDLPMLSNTINKALSYKIKEGDTIDFAELQEADQVAIRHFTPNIPDVMVVQEIGFEPDLEIVNGIRKVYLEAKRLLAA